MSEHLVHESAERRVRTALQGFLAISAGYGALGLILGLPGFDLPVEWLKPLPLHSWVIPGVALLLVVGLPLGAAAVAGWRNSPAAEPLAQAACVLLLGWLVFQVAFLGIRAPIQVVTASTAFVLAVLTTRTGGST